MSFNFSGEGGDAFDFFKNLDLPDMPSMTPPSSQGGSPHKPGSPLYLTVSDLLKIAPTPPMKAAAQTVRPQTPDSQSMQFSITVEEIEALGPYPGSELGASAADFPSFANDVVRVNMGSMFTALDFNDAGKQQALAAFIEQFNTVMAAVKNTYGDAVKSKEENVRVKAFIDVIAEVLSGSGAAKTRETESYWNTYTANIIRRFNRRFASMFAFDPFDYTATNKVKPRTENVLLQKKQDIYALLGLSSRDEKLDIDLRYLGKFNGAKFEPKVKPDPKSIVWSKSYSVYAVSRDGKLAGDPFAAIVRKCRVNIRTYYNRQMTNPFEGGEQNVLFADDGEGLPATCVVMAAPNGAYDYTGTVLMANFNRPVYNQPEDLAKKFFDSLENALTWVPMIPLNEAVRPGMVRVPFNPLFAKVVPFNVPPSEGAGSFGQEALDLYAVRGKDFEVMLPAQKILYVMAAYAETFSPSKEAVVGVKLYQDSADRAILNLAVTYNRATRPETTFSWRNKTAGIMLDHGMTVARAMYGELKADKRIVSPVQRARGMLLAPYLTYTAYVGEGKGKASMAPAGVAAVRLARYILLEWMLLPQGASRPLQKAGNIAVASDKFINLSYLSGPLVNADIKAYRSETYLPNGESLAIVTVESDGAKVSMNRLRQLIQQAAAVAARSAPSAASRPSAVGWLAPMGGRPSFAPNQTRRPAVLPQIRVRPPVHSFVPPPAVAATRSTDPVGTYVVRPSENLRAQAAMQKQQAAAQQAALAALALAPDVKASDDELVAFRVVEKTKMEVGSRGLAFSTAPGAFYRVELAVNRFAGKVERAPLSTLPAALGRKKFFAIRYPRSATSPKDHSMQEVARGQPFGRRVQWIVAPSGYITIEWTKLPGNEKVVAPYEYELVGGAEYTQMEYEDGTIIIIRVQRRPREPLLYLSELAIHQPTF